MSKSKGFGLERRRKVKYSEGFKDAVVESLGKGKSVPEAARYYEVPERSVYNWLNKRREREEPEEKGVLDAKMREERDKFNKLERLVSELSIKCLVLKEQVKIYEEMVGAEDKKKVSTKQLEELERLKREAQDLLVE